MNDVSVPILAPVRNLFHMHFLEGHPFVILDIDEHGEFSVSGPYNMNVRFGILSRELACMF